MIKREIRHLQQIFGMNAMFRRQGDPDARTNVDDLLVDGEWLADLADDARCEVCCGVALVGIVQLDNGEFISAQPRQHVSFLHYPFNTQGHLFE